jgi:hypothetical protein
MYIIRKALIMKNKEYFMIICYMCKLYLSFDINNSIGFIFGNILNNIYVIYKR